MLDAWHGRKGVQNRVLCSVRLRHWWAGELSVAIWHACCPAKQRSQAVLENVAYCIPTKGCRMHSLSTRLATTMCRQESR